MLRPLQPQQLPEDRAIAVLRRLQPPRTRQLRAHRSHIGEIGSLSSCWHFSSLGKYSKHTLSLIFRRMPVKGTQVSMRRYMFDTRVLFLSASKGRLPRERRLALSQVPPPCPPGLRRGPVATEAPGAGGRSPAPPHCQHQKEPNVMGLEAPQTPSRPKAASRLRAKRSAGCAPSKSPAQEGAAMSRTPKHGLQQRSGMEDSCTTRCNNVWWRREHGVG